MWTFLPFLNWEWLSQHGIQIQRYYETQVRTLIPPDLTKTQLVVPIILCEETSTVKGVGLLDLGAAGNFVDTKFALSHQISLEEMSQPLVVRGVDDKPLSSGLVIHHTVPLTLKSGVLHTETIRLIVVHSLRDKVILGFPWLRRHNPKIDWRSGQIQAWSSDCFMGSLSIPCRVSSIESPCPEDLSGIPKTGNHTSVHVPLCIRILFCS